MAPPRPLICHIIYRLAIGGLENGLVNLINHLPDDAYRHAIVCVTAATDFRQRIRRPDVPIHEIGKRPGKDIAAYGRMYRLLCQLRPALVHTRNLPAIDMIAPAVLARVPRFVHSEHGLDLLEIDGKNRRYNRLRRLSRLAVDRYITMSADLNDWLQREIGVPAARVETIYNGVDSERFSSSGSGRDALPPGFAPADAIVIGTIGRLDPNKNQLLLAEAFGRALAGRPTLRQRLRLAIIGEGDERAAIEAMLTRHDARALAWLPGFRNDTPALHRALDLFVLPSLREGISNTLLEAMASGRAVLATKVGGTPEIVPDGIVGTLVPPGDAEALASAIIAYAENPTRLKEQGEAGRAHVLRGFSLDSMMRRYDTVYRSQLEASRS